MLPVMTALCAFIASLCRSSTSLRLENLALRHQLAVYKQTVPRPRLRSSDRLFWAWLSRSWSGWQETLAFVQPRTVLAWQRKRFRDHWRRLRWVIDQARAFEEAGARTLIASLWPVDDQDTREWMTSLYRARFVERKSTAEALRSADRGRITSRRAAAQSTHPFYWAGFVAVGDWR